MNQTSEPFIRVSGDSSPFKAAGAIAAILRERQHVSVQAIGAAALNQAMKAIIYARRYLERDGLDLIFVPVFSDVELEGGTKTAMRFLVEVRPRAVGGSESPPEA